MSEQQTPCGTCHGQGGHVIDTSSNGITRQHWKSCSTCNGSGQRQ